MVAATKTQTLVLTGALILPAAFIAITGILDVVFNVDGPDQLFGWIVRTPIGALLFFPPIVLGAVGAAILLNLSRFCRVWFGPQRGTINLSVSFPGSTPYLVGASGAFVVASVLVLYGAKYAIRAAMVELIR
jgi:hypothetical protein